MVVGGNVHLTVSLQTGGSRTEISWGPYHCVGGGEYLLNVGTFPFWQTPLHPSEPIPDAPSSGKASGAERVHQGNLCLNSPFPAPQDMFAFMGSLDTKGTSYKYEVALAGPALELHNCMAKLLAHPLQRPCQSHASYSLLEDDDEATEVEATV